MAKRVGVFVTRDLLFFFICFLGAVVLCTAAKTMVTDLKVIRLC